MLTTQSAQPAAVLRPFVHWYLQRETVSKTGEVVEPILARAGAALIFQFTPIYEVQEYGTQQLRRSWPAAIIGPIAARKVRIVLNGHVQSLDVLFRPLGLYRFFGVPVAPLTGAGAEGHSVLGPEISHLHERLGNAANFAERIAILDDFLVHRLRQSDPLTPAAHALRLIASGKHSVPVAAGMSGMSERQLERRSLDCAGVSPKVLSRISRFQRAIKKHREGYGSWMTIAHEAGYYDQMHLIRDFHLFGGGAPTEVLKEVGDSHLISFFCK